MKYLFLDDERMPGDVTWVQIGAPKTYNENKTINWNIVRSYNDAVSWVLTNGFPDIISFDHDLGADEFDTNEIGQVVLIKSSNEKTGYDFAKFLIEYDMDTHTMPKEFSFTVHSKNPIGSKNIQILLDNYIRQK